MRRSIVLLAILGLAACGASGGSGGLGAAPPATPTTTPTPAPAGGGNVSPTSASRFDLELRRTGSSRDYGSATLDVARVVTFPDPVASPPASGFSCEAAGGQPGDVSGRADLDLTSEGTVPFATVSTGLPRVAEVWLMARARVVKHGRGHALHGQLTCLAADGRRFVVLRFVAPSAIALGHDARTRLAAVVDAGHALEEQGDCDRSCDEDDQHASPADAAQGWISISARHELAADGTSPADAAPVMPPAGSGPLPSTTPAAPFGLPATAQVCAKGQPCDCRESGGCLLECPAGGCTMSCELAGTCAMSCAGGGCTMRCEDAGTCAATCTGNGCGLSCNRTGTCGLTACTAGCSVACTNGACP